MKQITNKVKIVTSMLLCALGTTLVLGGISAEKSIAHYAEQNVRDTHSIRNLAFDDSLTSLRYAMASDDDTVVELHYTDEEVQKYISQQYGEKVKAHYPVQIHQYQVALEGGRWKEGDQHHRSGLLNTILSVNPIVVQDFIDKEYSFESDYAGKIPILVPLSYELDERNQWIFPKGEKELYEFWKEAVDKYVGNTYQLMASYTKPESRKSLDIDIDPYKKVGVEVIVVGVIPRNFEDYDVLMSSFVVPDWTKEKVPELDFVNKYGKTATVLEFNSTKERDRVVAQSLRERGKLKSPPFFTVYPLNGNVAQISVNSSVITEFLITMSAFCFMLAFIVMLSTATSLKIKVMSALSSAILGTLVGMFGLTVLIRMFGENLTYYVAQYGEATKDLVQVGQRSIVFPVAAAVIIYTLNIMLGVAAGIFGRKQS